MLFALFGDRLMRVLYYILIICLVAVLGTALAAYLRVRRHRKNAVEDATGVRRTKQ